MRALLVLAAILAASPALAGGYLNPVGDATPPVGWRPFCERYPDECKVEPGGPHPVLWHANNRHLAAWVNAFVNQRTKEITDRDHWGVPERWDLAEDGSGDCEDHQLLKRKTLAGLASGVLFPRSAMRVALVLTPGGEQHAVLMIRTTEGDFVLDNILKDMRPWDRTPYIFVSRESDDGRGWVDLGARQAPRVTVPERAVAMGG